MAGQINGFSQDTAEIYTADSAYTLSGQVMGMDGDPVAGVTISVEGALCKGTGGDGKDAVERPDGGCAH